MLINGRAGGLDDEHIGAADVLVNLKGDFSVGESMQACSTHGDAEVLSNLLRECRMRARVRRKSAMTARRVRRGLPPEPTEQERSRRQEDDDDLDGPEMGFRERGDR